MVGSRLQAGLALPIWQVGTLSASRQPPERSGQLVASIGTLAIGTLAIGSLLSQCLLLMVRASGPHCRLNGANLLLILVPTVEASQRSHCCNSLLLLQARALLYTFRGTALYELKRVNETRPDPF